MEHYGVPGVGIAVIEGGKVAWFRVYGVADRETGEAATPATLFQAGSVSKPVTAFGAMRLVEAGKLGLDGAVNDRLTSWRIPDTEYTAERAVTLGQLLSHTAGTTVHGFPGYEPGAPVPSLVQVLDGVDPANTAPIRVDKLPGEGWRYSGGGYTVVQQLMIDVSGKPFPELMDELVLRPLGMSDSTFSNPLPPELLRRAAAGVLPEGRDVRGKRHVYPEMAAAGLWTTAGDLARFAVEVQRALAGESEVLSREIAEKMVEPVVPDFGRGFALNRREGHPYFGHNGWDEGFCALLLASRETGQGVVVMINSNHPDFMNEVARAVAIEYGWPGYREHRALPISEAAIATFAGRYRYNGELSFRLYGEGGRLYMQYVGSAPEELIRVGEDRYVRRERPKPIVLAVEDGTPVFVFAPDDGEREPHARLADGEKPARELLAEGDVAGALAAYRALKESGDEAGSEKYLNSAGLDLAREDDHALGIALLAVNCELYPESANTWDSVGLAYRSAGHRELARLYYRKALEIDPKFPSALAALAELADEK
jgi:CubicO group peptidase (beta-lactamase class C family)